LLCHNVKLSERAIETTRVDLARLRKTSYYTTAARRGFLGKSTYVTLETDAVKAPRLVKTVDTLEWELKLDVP